MSQENKTVKLKDIAQALNLSIGTVQRALNDKGGYSAETKQMILDKAAELGYKANPAASALRRSATRIAVVLPHPEGTDKYYFQYIWQGIERAQREFSIYNVILENYSTDSELKELRRLLDSSEPVHGIITRSDNSTEFIKLVDEFNSRDIAVCITNATSDHNKRALLFSPPVVLSTGRLAADIFAASLRNAAGSLILLGGDKNQEFQVIRGTHFCTSLADYCPGINVIELHNYHDTKQLKTLTAKFFQTMSDICGIYAVSSRETLCMCEVIQQLGLSGRITSVGTDVFPALLPYFSDSTLTSSIYQYPVQRGYLCVEILVSHILGLNRIDAMKPVPITAVFRSNAEAFCNIAF